MATCSGILIGSIHLLGRAGTLRLRLLCTQRLSGTVAPLQSPASGYTLAGRSKIADPAIVLLLLLKSHQQATLRRTETAFFLKYQDKPERMASFLKFCR
jgi:hypothetical protein